MRAGVGAGRPEPCGPVPGQGAPPRGLVLPVLHGREQGRLRNPMMRGWGSHLLLGPPVGPASMGGGAEKSQEGVDSNEEERGQGQLGDHFLFRVSLHLISLSLCLCVCLSVCLSLFVFLFKSPCVSASLSVSVFLCV